MLDNDGDGRPLGMEATLEQGLGSVIDQEPKRLGGVPEWFNELRREGWARYQELPMPSRKDEEWRFASIGQLDFSGARFPDNLNIRTRYQGP